jgi:MscS family membrane protein
MAINIDKPLREVLQMLSPYFGNDYIFAFSLFIIFVVLAFAISYAYKVVLHLIYRRSPANTDAKIIDETRTPVILFIVLIGVKSVITALGLKEGMILTTQNALSSVLIAVFAYILIKITDIIIEAWGRMWKRRTRSKYKDTIFPLIRKFSMVFIIIVAVIVILSVWGIEIAPFLAGLGIAGIAIGLAMQDSLSDLFSGVMLILDTTYKVGDKIRLDTGEVGIVHEITMRSTRVQTYDGNVIIIPNSNMAKTKIINYAQPIYMERGVVPFGVIYGSNVGKTKEVAKRALKSMDGILEDPEPTVDFLELADYYLSFRGTFWVSDFTTRWDKEREAVQRVYEELNKEGIEFAFPTRTLHMYQHKTKGEE